MAKKTVVIAGVTMLVPSKADLEALRRVGKKTAERMKELNARRRRTRIPDVRFKGAGVCG